MKRRVAVMDTSFFCCWLKVPGRETAGSGSNVWSFQRVHEEIEEERRLGATIVLPLATILETGNQIAQASERRFELASALCNHLKDAMASRPPWVAFREQSSFWSDEQLLQLLEDWPALARAKFSFGDATIKHVADYYAEAGFHVRILTADATLRAYEPAQAMPLPRRSR